MTKFDHFASQPFDEADNGPQLLLVLLLIVYVWPGSVLGLVPLPRFF